MQAVTVGFNFYVSYLHPVSCRENEDPEKCSGAGCYRLVMLEAGSAVVRLNGTRSIVLAPALLCLNDTDSLAFENPKDLSLSVVYFEPRIVNSRFSTSNIRAGGPDFNQTDWQDRFSLLPFIERNLGYIGILEPGIAYFREIQALFKRLKKEVGEQADGYWPCRSRSFFIEMLFLLQKMNPGRNNLLSGPSGRSRNPAEEVMLYLNTHYRDKITIDGLARQFHTNRTTLMKQFHEYAGMTINRYLTDIRIRISAQMLRDTNVSITEVMERTGFVDATHFGRTFRKVIGEVPSEYRAKNCWVIRGE